jgi:transcription termination factor Rho
MNPTFRQRQGAGAAGGNNNNNNNRRRRGPRQSTEGLPKGDTQIDPELLPETDFSHYDDMPPAELLKLAKKHKISADLLKYEVIEALLVKVNADKEAIYAKGILEVMNDGWGFLRKDSYQPSPEDTYVGQTLIKKMNLRAGDILFGLCKPQKEGERYRGLFRVESVNNQGITTFTAKPRKNFDELTPLFPDERLVMETSPDNIPTRIVDLISPIGKGQRALIVSPPKAGKTTMMKSMMFCRKRP